MKFRFDMRGAQESGEPRHPELVIYEWFPLARGLEPVTIADCWMFSADDRADAPDYFVRVSEYTVMVSR